MIGRCGKILLPLILTFTFVLELMSQISFGGIPKSLPVTRVVGGFSVPCINVDLDSLTIDKKVESDAPCAMTFATAIPVDIDLKKEAISMKISDEIVQYRLMISSKGATSLNFIFSKFELPDKAKLFLSTPNMSEVFGAYTNKSIFSPFQFATTPIESDTILFVYEELINQPGKLKISRVNRGFYSLRKLPQFARSQECEIDAECESDSFENMRRATCLYVINGTSYCTGTLVNNTKENGVPYILTSAHCLFDVYNKVDTSLAKTCVFFFGYKSPICNSQIEGTREKSIVGAKAVSCYNSRDALLLKLLQMPPKDYMPYYAPWDATGDLRGPSICFHHPSGDVMKASYEADELRDTSFSSLIFDRDCHLKVNYWERGISEGGSSGAALYNHGMIVGALSGGAKDISCSNTGFDCFWSLNKAWQAFAPYLSPLSDSSKICKGFEPYSSPCKIIANYKKNSEVNEGYVDDYGYVAGTNDDNITQIAERFILSQGSLIYGVSFFPVIAVNDINNPMVISLLDSEKNVIWSSEICVKNVEYIKKSASMSEKELTSMSYKENYVRFEEPISVDSVVYVAFDYSNTLGSFAMFNVVDSCEVSTAYYNKGGEWYRYDCEKMSSLMVNLTAQLGDINSEEFKMSDEIIVYPNPSNGDFSIDLGGKCSAIITITNSLGQVVWIESVDNQRKIEISSNFSSGVYTFEVATIDGVRVRKVMVK